MKKVQVLLQFIIDGAAVWQTVKDIEPKYARRMSPEELDAIGVHAREIVKRVAVNKAINPPVKKPASGGLKIRRTK